MATETTPADPAAAFAGAQTSGTTETDEVKEPQASSPENQPAATEPEPPATPAASDGKPYRVTTKVEGEVTSEESAAKLIADLMKHAGEDGKLVLHVEVGALNAAGPKQAVSDVGQTKDLDGDYDVVLATNIKSFPGVKAGTKPAERQITFG